MAYLIQKRGKFMTGHGYCTGSGYRYSWSIDEAGALRFSDDDPTVDTHARMTGGKIVRRENTHHELRKLGRKRTQIRDATKAGRAS
jgi:hypothetical protein